MKNLAKQTRTFATMLKDKGVVSFFSSLKSGGGRHPEGRAFDLRKQEPYASCLKTRYFKDKQKQNSFAKYFLIDKPCKRCAENHSCKQGEDCQIEKEFWATTTVCRKPKRRVQ